eukprot:7126524-Prymnesium_polylepis.1
MVDDTRRHPILVPTLLRQPRPPPVHAVRLMHEYTTCSDVVRSLPTHKTVVDRSRAAFYWWWPWWPRRRRSRRLIRRIGWRRRRRLPRPEPDDLRRCFGLTACAHREHASSQVEAAVVGERPPAPHGIEPPLLIGVSVALVKVEDPRVLVHVETKRLGK